MFIVAEKQKADVNEEQILSYLQDIVGKIKTEEDPLELNMYRRLFRKAVPLTLRSYFAAYLLKEGAGGRMSGRFASRNDRSPRSGRKDRNERTERQERVRENEGRGGRQDSRAAEPRVEKSDRNRNSDNRRQDRQERSADQPKSEPRPVLADDVSTTLFVSIGRNRRVYPRDLIGLILQNVEIERDHIGDIRVLDNYSFVQVITEDAGKIIDALNEFEFRGRKLAVSYSRKREESAASSESVSSGLEDDTMAPESAGSALYTSPEPESDDFAAGDSAEAGFSGETESDLPDNEENNGNI
jgi:hypothetical protein